MEVEHSPFLRGTNPGTNPNQKYRRNRSSLQIGTFVVAFPRQRDELSPLQNRRQSDASHCEAIHDADIEDERFSLSDSCSQTIASRRPTPHKAEQAIVLMLLAW